MQSNEGRSGRSGCIKLKLHRNDFKTSLLMSWNAVTGPRSQSSGEFKAAALTEKSGAATANGASTKYQVGSSE